MKEAGDATVALATVAAAKTAAAVKVATANSKKAVQVATANSNKAVRSFYDHYQPKPKPCFFCFGVDL